MLVVYCDICHDLKFYKAVDVLSVGGFFCLNGFGQWRALRPPSTDIDTNTGVKDFQKAPRSQGGQAGH